MPSVGVADGEGGKGELDGEEPAEGEGEGEHDTAADMPGEAQQGHGTGAPLPAGQTKPMGHCVAVVASAAQKLPAGQATVAIDQTAPSMLTDESE